MIFGVLQLKYCYIFFCTRLELMLIFRSQLLSIKHQWCSSGSLANIMSLKNIDIVCMPVICDTISCDALLWCSLKLEQLVLFPTLRMILWCLAHDAMMPLLTKPISYSMYHTASWGQVDAMVPQPTMTDRSTESTFLLEHNGGPRHDKRKTYRASSNHAVKEEEGLNRHPTLLDLVSINVGGTF